MIFSQLCASSGIPRPVKEYQFHPTRKWRADYAWPDHKLILEVEGGVWTGGRHTRGKGFLGDMEKYNAAVALGWRVLRITPKELVSSKTILLIKQSIQNGKVSETPAPRVHQ